MGVIVAYGEARLVVRYRLDTSGMSHSWETLRCLPALLKIDTHKEMGQFWNGQALLLSLTEILCGGKYDPPQSLGEKIMGAERGAQECKCGRLLPR